MVHLFVLLTFSSSDRLAPPVNIQQFLLMAHKVCVYIVGGDKIFYQKTSLALEKLL